MCGSCHLYGSSNVEFVNQFIDFFLFYCWIQKKDQLLCNIFFIEITQPYFQELVLDEDGKKVTERTCYPGNNSHGMVAWKIDLKTPEYPKGREIVVIANDISHQIGLS